MGVTDVIPGTNITIDADTPAEGQVTINATAGPGGTTVSANPASDPTDVLRTLRISGSDYSLHRYVDPAPVAATQYYVGDHVNIATSGREIYVALASKMQTRAGIPTDGDFHHIDDPATSYTDGRIYHRGDYFKHETLGRFTFVNHASSGTLTEPTWNNFDLDIMGNVYHRGSHVTGNYYRSGSIARPSDSSPHWFYIHSNTTEVPGVDTDVAVRLSADPYVRLTQAEYDALVPDIHTWYDITDA